MHQIVTIKKSDKMFRNKNKIFRNEKSNASKKNKLAFNKKIFLLIAILLMMVKSVHNSHVTSCDMTSQLCQMTKCIFKFDF